MYRTHFLEAMDGEMKKFFEEIEIKFRMEKGCLWKEWTCGGLTKKVQFDLPVTPQATVVSPPPLVVEEKSGKELKKSNYQVYFSIQRNKLMKENPNMTFGEISKMVSSMWKQVSPEEKKTYVQNENDQLLHLSIKDLRRLCKEKQIDSKSLKREELIEVLTAVAKPSPPPMKKEPTVNIISTSAIIPAPSLSTTPLGRSKVEIALEDEEDFFFEEELQSDDGIDDNDDDDMDDQDMEDDDIFIDTDD